MAQVVTIEEPRVARWLFGSTSAAWLWLIPRVYLGYLWLHAGWEKVTGTSGGTWTWHWAYTSESWLKSSAGLKGFASFALSNSQGPHAAVNYGFYAAFLRWLARSGGWMAPLIAIGEVVIGAALLLGAFTAIAAFFGGVLTMAFGMAGVAGVNPVFFLAEVLLILAWRNAGYIGLDRFLLPKLGTPWHPGTMFRGDRPPMDERTAPDTEAGP
jgi:thiosulfate dehydrogenase [quinone] large subunit